MIKELFGKRVCENTVRSILRHKMKMKFSKPFIRDRKRPENAEQMLKEKMAEKVDKIKQMGIELSRVGVGFVDETSPQLTANTVRLWSFEKPIVKKTLQK